jgi:DNA-binding NarL/FixJ family response regulator
VELFEKHRPDVAILDGRLPDFHGVEAVSRILKMHPDAKLMLLSIDETEGDVAKALAAGVKSYLPKSVPRAELITAIRALHRGETYFPKEIAALAKKYRDRPPLSEREMQILKLVAQGQANKQIADELGIAEITVKVRVSHILEKLGAPDRTRATTKAIELGILKI